MAIESRKQKRGVEEGKASETLPKSKPLISELRIDIVSTSGCCNINKVFLLINMTLCFFSCSDLCVGIDFYSCL